jgi:hypothetical protein
LIPGSLLQEPLNSDSRAYNKRGTILLLNRETWLMNFGKTSLAHLLVKYLFMNNGLEKESSKKLLGLEKKLRLRMEMEHFSVPFLKLRGY